MTGVAERWDRVAALVQQRRGEMGGMTAAKLAVAAGVSPAMISAIETAKGVSPQILGKVSLACGYEWGGLATVRDGGKVPVPVTPLTTMERVAALEIEVAALKAGLRTLLDRTATDRDGQ